ncbi:Chromosome-partitioning protein Spo0J [Methylophilaceae bacterium]|nr:Chromosome-partitioning protein Spo0J [Methylophilaceae bacterium]
MSKPTEGLQELPLKSIKPSPSNPRKRFPDEMIAELASSIEQQGLMQPILARPVGKGYEIVAGECRWRASCKVAEQHPDRGFIPAIVRNLSDRDALERQVIENLHRTDLHPLEEALGFKQLLANSQDLAGFTINDLAAKIGKSRTYMYASLKLTELCQEAQDKFLDGVIQREVAVLIARIPGHKLQAAALKEILKGNYQSIWEPMSYRQAKDLVLGKYTTNLKKAAFDITDATLAPAFMSCGCCPKRSGNCRDEFPEIESADVCTDPDCYQGKYQDHIKWLEESSGKRVVSGKAAEEIMPYSTNKTQLNKDYIALDSICQLVSNPENKTMRELLGDNARNITIIARDDAPPVEAMKKDTLLKALENLGHEKPPSHKEQQEDRDIEAKKETQRRTELAFKVNQAMFDHLQTDTNGKFTRQLLIALVSHEWQGLGSDLSDKRLVHRLYKGNPDDDIEYGEAMLDIFRDSIKDMTTAELLRLLAIIKYKGEIERYWWNLSSEPALLNTIRATCNSFPTPPTAAQASDQSRAEPAAPAVDDASLPAGFQKAKAKALAKKAKAQTQKESAAADIQSNAPAAEAAEASTEVAA